MCAVGCGQLVARADACHATVGVTPSRTKQELDYSVPRHPTPAVLPRRGACRYPPRLPSPLPFRRVLTRSRPCHCLPMPGQSAIACLHHRQWTVEQSAGDKRQALLLAALMAPCVQRGKGSICLLFLSILNLLATRTHISPTGAAPKHTPLCPCRQPPGHRDPAHANPSCSLTFSSRDRISRKDGRAVAERAQQSRSRAANVELTVLGMMGIEPWMTALYTSI